MRVLFAASECVPFVKTGGLADVVASLPKALASLGVDVRIVLPAYREVREQLAATWGDSDIVKAYDDLFGAPARLRSLRAEGLDLLLIDAPHLFDRPGNPYVQADGSDWPDNHVRFGALSWVTADVAEHGLGDWHADLVHVHDWHTGLVPAYLSMASRPVPPAMISIHNILYQGLFPASVRGALGLPESGFTPDGYEFYGQLGFLKAGLAYAQRIGTVSPTYARELLQPAFGLGLEGMLAHRGQAFVGILNGIDMDIWNPATDPLIAAHYKAPNKRARARNKRALEDGFGLPPQPDSPLFCVVSRLSEQKGLDLLLDALPTVLGAGGRLVVQGTGSPALEAAFRDAAVAHPGQVGVRIGYDEAFAHLMQAGADAIIVPSRFEPCGLTQMYGLRYGCLPVVAETGGLADTVTDADAVPAKGTGFTFKPGTAAALADALGRAVACYQAPERWRAVMRRAMRRPVGWDASAKAYMAVYEEMRRADVVPA